MSCPLNRRTRLARLLFLMLLAMLITASVLISNLYDGRILAPQDSYIFGGLNGYVTYVIGWPLTYFEYRAMPFDSGRIMDHQIIDFELNSQRALLNGIVVVSIMAATVVNLFWRNRFGRHTLRLRFALFVLFCIATLLTFVLFADRICKHECFLGLFDDEIEYDRKYYFYVVILILNWLGIYFLLELVISLVLRLFWRPRSDVVLESNL